MLAGLHRVLVYPMTQGNGSMEGHTTVFYAVRLLSLTGALHILFQSPIYDTNYQNICILSIWHAVWPRVFKHY